MLTQISNQFCHLVYITFDSRDVIIRRSNCFSVVTAYANDSHRFGMRSRVMLQLLRKGI